MSISVMRFSTYLFISKTDGINIWRQSMDSNTSTQLVTHFSVHIQYFYNLSLTKCSLPRSLQPLINSEATTILKKKDQKKIKNYRKAEGNIVFSASPVMTFRFVTVHIITSSSLQK